MPIAWQPVLRLPGSALTVLLLPCILQVLLLLSLLHGCLCSLMACVSGCPGFFCSHQLTYNGFVPIAEPETTPDASNYTIEGTCVLKSRTMGWFASLNLTQHICSCDWLPLYGLRDDMC